MDGNKKDYFESLDGFRGLAALLVLLFHSKFECFKTLWIGVPMFFTLSGFLITRILIVNKGSTNYFKAFYFKRALRIFPIYYLLLIFCIVWCKLMDVDISQWPYYIVYLQTFLLANSIEPFFCDGMMTHTWSLSVEELFYLAWPLIVTLFSTQSLFRFSLITGIFVVCFKLFYVFVLYNDHAAQQVLLSFWGSLDSLMAGSMLAILHLKKQKIFSSENKVRFAYSCSFFAVLLASFMSFSPSNSERIDVTLNVISSCLVVFLSFFLIEHLASYEKASLWRRLFTTSFMKFTGKISYGLYLYHFVVYLFVKSFLFHIQVSINPIFTLALKILTTFTISLISWYLVERPILRFKGRVNYEPIKK